ncbi:MAG: hypothetical protein FWD60_03820 [Candidatus Azobacteroides sp.]|nr:hypothetical protein [Candidatus Azobacteroides sp.]
MKKNLLLLAAIFMAVAAFAQTPTVAGAGLNADGDGNIQVSNWCNNTNWSNNDPGNIMVSAGGNVYTKTYSDVPAGKYEFKIFEYGTWASYADYSAFDGDAPVWTRGDGTNIVFALSETSDVTITYNQATGRITGLTSSNGFGVFVAGDGKGNFCGNKSGAWWTDYNLMKSSGGVYEITFPNVLADTYDFKIGTGKWAGDGKNMKEWGFSAYAGGANSIGRDNGGNMEFQIYAPCVIKIIFDANKDGGTITDVLVGYTVAGDARNDANGSFCNGIYWDPTENLIMVESDIASIMFPRVAPSDTKYEFKFTGGDWNGSGGEYGYDQIVSLPPTGKDFVAGITRASDNNVQFTLSETADVLINFRHSDRKITKVQTLTSYTLAGTATLFGTSSELLSANLRAATADEDFQIFPENDMTYMSAEKVWEKVYKNVPAGTYEYKVAGNRDFEVYEYPVGYGQNNMFVVPAEGYPNGADVTITFDPVNNILTQSLEPSILTGIKNNVIKDVVLSVSNGTINCSAEKFVIYNIMGVDVTALNGNLSGVYIVKYDGKASKILVK